MILESYGKWLENMLIPNLLKNFILVVDNAPYHNVQTKLASSWNSKIDNITIEWLNDRNIYFNPNSLNY